MPIVEISDERKSHLKSELILESSAAIGSQIKLIGFADFSPDQVLVSKKLEAITFLNGPVILIDWLKNRFCRVSSYCYSTLATQDESLFILENQRLVKISNFHVEGWEIPPHEWFTIDDQNSDKDKLREAISRADFLKASFEKLEGFAFKGFVFDE
jgi:hypothetical protein